MRLLVSLVLASAGLAGCSTSGDADPAKRPLPEGYEVEHDESVPIWLPGSISVESGVVTLKGDNTRIAFVGRTVSGIHHTCGFETFDGRVTVNAEGVPQSIELTITTDSLYCDDLQLIERLKSADFLHVAEHPQITFQSTQVAPTEGQEGSYDVTGNLTIRGVTQQIRVPLRVEQSDGKEFLADAAFSLDRTTFGITHGAGEIEPMVEMMVRLGVRAGRFGG
jgi:polyisoprenoid-binding protein YceI